MHLLCCNDLDWIGKCEHKITDILKNDQIWIIALLIIVIVYVVGWNVLM